MSTSLIIHCGVLGTCSCLNSFVGCTWPWHSACLSAYMLCAVCNCHNYYVHVSLTARTITVPHSYLTLMNKNKVVAMYNYIAYSYVAIHNMCGHMHVRHFILHFLYKSYIQNSKIPPFNSNSFLVCMVIEHIPTSCLHSVCLMLLQMSMALSAVLLPYTCSQCHLIAFALFRPHKLKIVFYYS